MRHPLKPQTIDRLSQSQPTPNVPADRVEIIKRVSKLMAAWTLYHDELAREELKLYPQYFKMGDTK